MEKVKEFFRNLFKGFTLDTSLDLKTSMEVATRKANEFIYKLAIVCFAICVVGLIAIACGLMEEGKNKTSSYIYIGISCFIYLVIAILGKATHCDAKLKYVFISLIMFATLPISAYLDYLGAALFAIVIVLTTQYFDSKLTIITVVIAEIMYILAIILHAVVSYHLGSVEIYLFYYDITNIVYSGGKMLVDASSSVDLSSFGAYLSGFFSYYFVGNTILIFIAAFVSICTTRRGKQMVIEESEISAAKVQSELETNEAKVRIMISQIQPHFLYNTLNSIYYLVEKNPDEAQEAISDFSDYLRETLNFNSSQEVVPFSKELSYVEKYLSLEKMRFGDKLNIEYDIKCKTFRVPSLSIQPLVENAVKHGVCQKAGGGTIKIISRDIYECFEVIISDNGAGFDTTKALDDDKVHIGLENTKTRLEKMIGATIKIDSLVDEGTTITIRIPKENYYEDIGG